MPAWHLERQLTRRETPETFLLQLLESCSGYACGYLLNLLEHVQDNSRSWSDEVALKLAAAQASERETADP